MKLGTVTLTNGAHRLVAPVDAHDAPEAGPWIDLHEAGVAAHVAHPHVLGSLEALLEAGDEGLHAAKVALDHAHSHAGAGASWIVTADGARLRAPILRPGKVLALAGNYMAHRTEGASGLTTPAEQLVPEVFCKPMTSIVGHGEAIRIPGAPVIATDYEGELGVVIGRRGHRISEADAMQYVAGYFPLNDVSGRKLDPGMDRDPAQAARNGYFDWLIGKWPDTFCPIGPWMVTADEVADPMNLHMVVRVNGERRQETSTAMMLHSIVRTIAWCSKFMTFEPGDIIATGTPAGVGSARGIFLQAGDVVEVEIEGLGILRNPVV